MKFRDHSRYFAVMRRKGNIPALILLLASVLFSVGSHAAPPMIASFPGISQTAYTPPDPMIAAGPSNLVSIVNSTFTIYTKGGINLFSTNLAGWFAGLNPPGTPFQPRLVYDSNGGHFIMLALASGNPHKSSYMISVSSNSNPVGIWWIWNVDAGLDQSTASGNTADSPGLGYDDDAVYITSNQYDSHNNFQYAKLRIISKAQLYSGSNFTWVDFWNQTDANGQGVFGWMPARAQSSLHGNYLISTRPNGSNYVTLWKVSNPLGTNPGPALSLQATLPVQPYSVPPNAPEQGGIATINTGDCRSQEILFQNGALVTAFTEAYNWGSVSVSALRTLLINATSSSITLDNRFGSDKVWLYYPAIVRDASGNMAMVFNRSATNEYAGTFYTAWLAGETNWETGLPLKAGEGFYGSGVNNWGNYTGASLDPADPTKAWICGEYAASGGSQWGTWIGEIGFPGITNDNCAGAVSLTNGVPYSMNMAGATATNDPAPSCGLGLSNGVWFSFTPNASGSVLINTCGSDFPTVLQVYSGTCAGLIPVSCNAGTGPACLSAQASLQFNAVGGTKYYLLAGGNGGTSGNLTIAAYSPANDTCVGAIALTNGTPFLMNTASATSLADPVTVCSASAGKGVWFSFTPSVSGLTLISTCGSDFDTVLQVYDGNCASLNPIACNDNNGPACGGASASLSFFGDAGSSYLIFAGGAGGAGGNLSVEAYSPANDLCAGAIQLPAYSSHTINTTSAGAEGDPDMICGLPVGKGVWFSYTPNVDGKTTITTCGDFDTVLQIYQGTCGSLNEVDCNFANNCSGAGASVQFSSFAGTPYMFFAAGYSGESGTLTISNYLCQPPVITNGMTNVVLTSTGILVTATVEVSGTPPFNFNWSDGPLSTNTGGNPSVSFLIPLDQITDYLTETNFSTISVNVGNSCGGAGGSGGFLSCIVCLSRGVPVTSSAVVTASGTGLNLPTSCGNLGFSSRWFDMAAADSGMAEVSVLQTFPTNCLVSVFSGILPDVVAVNCNKTFTNRETRIQFPATTNQHYYFVVTNGGTVTNMTFGFVPQLSGVKSNDQFQIRTGAGAPLIYTLQGSTDLSLGSAWSNLFTAAFPTTGLLYSDSAATNLNQRFYRIIPGPGP